MSEYLTTKELSGRIKMTPGTIRNLIWKKKLEKEIHYIKPTPRKLLFIWGAIEAWLHGNGKVESDNFRSHKKSLIKV